VARVLQFNETVGQRFSSRDRNHKGDNMQYKNLGKSGLVVSRVSFGDPTKGRHSWILNEEQSRPIIVRPLKQASIFSTPPICTKQVPVKRSWAVR